jgi:hypothetical protein
MAQSKLPLQGLRVILLHSVALVVLQLLESVASYIAPTPASAVPVNGEYPTPSSYQPVGYGTTVYGGQTYYGSSGFSTPDGSSNPYPYTYPSFYQPGYSSGATIQPEYPQYSTGRVNNSVLVNPTVVNSPIYNSTLINPTIVTTPTYGEHRYRSRTTTIIHYPVPYGASGVTIPNQPYRYRTYLNY